MSSLSFARGDSLRRTTTAPPLTIVGSAVSMFGWVNMANDVDFHCPFAIDDALGVNGISIETLPGDNVLRILYDDGSDVPIAALTVGAWHYVGMVMVRTVNSIAVTGYVSAVGGGAFTTATNDDPNPFTTASIWLGDDQYNDPWEGQIARHVVLASELSAAEIVNIQWADLPLFNESIFASYPLYGLTNATKDLSGQGNDYNVTNGAPTSSDASPPTRRRMGIGVIS